MCPFWNLARVMIFAGEGVGEGELDAHWQAQFWETVDYT